MTEAVSNESPTTRSVAYDVVCASDDRPSWLKSRSMSIGASEIASVFGESRWKSAIALYEEKVNGALSADETEAQFWGLRLERTIAEVYAERTGRPTKWSGVMLRSEQYPWLTATLDALTVDVGDPVEHGWPFDSKTSHAFKAHEWEDGAPREYYLQAQQQMLVTGARKATIGCLLGGQRLVWCDVERDEVEIRRIIHMSRIFWHECVLKRVPPMPDGSESSSRALLALYPESVESNVLLDSDMDDLYEELSEMKKTEKAIKLRVDTIENRFKAALGTAECGVLPSRNVVTWKQRKGTVSHKKCAESLGATAADLERFRGPATRTFAMKDAKEL